MKRFLAVQHSFAEFFGALEAQWEARDIGFKYVRPVTGEDTSVRAGVRNARAPRFARVGRKGRFIKTRGGRETGGKGWV